MVSTGVNALATLLVVVCRIGLDPSDAHFSTEVVKDNEDVVMGIYNGSSINALLELCNGSYVYKLMVQRKEDFRKEQYNPFNPCPVIELGLNRDLLGPAAFAKRREQRWHDLRKAQNTLRAFRKRLYKKTYILQFALLAALAAGGLYLVGVGHYNFRTIFFPYEHDPTSGIPCWQFIRMGYMAASHKHKDLSVRISNVYYSNNILES